MKSFIIVLSCLSAVALANPTQEVLEYFVGGRRTCRLNCERANPGTNPLVSCPPTNCPPPVRNPQCGEPDCSIEANQRVLHAHADPNLYYQCAPLDAWGRWRVVEMTCGCQTFFYSPANRCVHRDEWQRECITQPDFPIFRECPIDCPGDCNGNGPSTLPSTTTQAPPQTTQGPPDTPIPTGPVGEEGGDDDDVILTTNTPPNGCSCPCVPCVWWPCQPCLANCACGNNQPQQNRPQLNQPWQSQPQQNRPQQDQPQLNRPWQSQPQQNRPWQNQPQREQPQQNQQPWQSQPQQNQQPWQSPI